MARGWESKSVESQIESAESRGTPRGRELTSAEMAKARELSSLESSRKRVLHDLATTKHQGYRESLESALRHLEKKIAAFHADSESVE